MPQETEPFWTKAAPRHQQLDWRHRLEALLDRLYDAYTALWDLMPGIASLAFLLWLINAAGPR